MLAIQRSGIRKGPGNQVLFVRDQGRSYKVSINARACPNLYLRLS